MSSSDLTAAYLAVPCPRSQFLAALIPAPPRVWTSWVQMSAQLSLWRQGERDERLFRLVREWGAPGLGVRLRESSVG